MNCASKFIARLPQTVPARRRNTIKSHCGIYLGH
jgi:hypothetical protein